MFLGGLLLRSAYARRAQITEFRQEMQREAWRQEARAARSMNLSTDRYWRDDGEQLFHCLSPYKELGTVAEPLGLGPKNNLAYYVDGDAERIHQMKLVLNVYHNVKPRHEAKQAHQALVQAAKRLTQAALHTLLPKAAEQAIATGKPWQGTVKTATLELVRDDWPTGKGYTLDFLVRPNQ